MSKTIGKPSICTFYTSFITTSSLTCNRYVLESQGHCPTENVPIADRHSPHHRTFVRETCIGTQVTNAGFYIAATTIPHVVRALNVNSVNPPRCTLLPLVCIGPAEFSTEILPSGLPWYRLGPAYWNVVEMFVVPAVVGHCRWSRRRS